MNTTTAMMFDDDDDDNEMETPRAHIEDFLANVETDPYHNLPSEKSEKRRHLKRSFVKTPRKEAKTRYKSYQRLSTSLPSPGSLITPKSSIQHLLLGTDSAKTPLQRRASSARSTRSDSRSLLQQAPVGWGQKVSLSPMLSPSPLRNEGESTNKLFNPPKHRRSFRIPDPPSDVGSVPSQHSVGTRDSSDLNGEEDVYEDHPNKHVGINSKLSHSVAERLGNPFDSKTGLDDHPDINTIHNDQRDTSTNEQELNDHPTEHRGSLISRADVSIEHSDNFDDPPIVSAEHSEQPNSLHHLQNSHYVTQKNAGKNASMEMIKVLGEMSRSMQMEKASKIYDLDSVSSEDSFKHSMSPSSSKSKKNKSMSMNNRTQTLEKGQNSKRNSTISRVSNSHSNHATPVTSSKKASLTRSGNKASSFKKQDSLLVNNDKVTDRSMAGNDSELLSLKSVDRSVGKETTTKRTPAQSQNSKDVSSSTKRKQSEEGSSVVKRIGDDKNVSSDTNSPIVASSSSKKRRTGGWNNSNSNPPSSTPLKRSKSVLSSTKMYASVSNRLSSKGSPSGSKSVNGFSTIGDISPIRPDEEHGESRPGLELATSTDEDNNPDGTSRGGVVEKLTKKSHGSNKTINKERSNNQEEEEPLEEGDEEDECPSGFSPLKTPVIDWNKRPQPVSASGKKLPQTVDTDKVDNIIENQRTLKKKKTASSTRRAPTTLLPRKTVKFYSELYSSMKLDKEALEEIETVSGQFLANTLETVESYCLHAGRKVINEADFVLLMKIQKLIKNKEDLYDLIREYLPMELRCELIPCFPSQ